MKPAFRVVANHQDITATIADRLIAIEVSDKSGVRSDRATLTIDDRDQRLEIPRTGATLEISLGYEGQQLVRMGSYIVDEVEIEGPERQMIIRANAADMSGNIKAPRERSWPDITFEKLVRKIAQEHTLTASIPKEFASRHLGHVDQTDSDMQLLTRICAEQGATFKIADKRLVVAARAAGKTASGKVMPVITIRADNCAGWSANLSERNKYKSVLAYWQNHAVGERVEVQAGEGEPSLALKHSYKSSATALQAAKSKLDALARGTKTLTISGYIGDPFMSAERIAILTGFRVGIDGAMWVVDEVTHSLSGDGYINNISLSSK